MKYFISFTFRKNATSPYHGVGNTDVDVEGGITSMDVLSNLTEGIKKDVEKDHGMDATTLIIVITHWRPFEGQ